MEVIIHKWRWITLTICNAFHSQLSFTHLWIHLLTFQFIICGLTLNYIDLICVVTNHNCILYEGQGEDTLGILQMQNLDDWWAIFFSYIRILSFNRLKYLFFANRFILLSWLQGSMILLMNVRFDIFQLLWYIIKENVISRFTILGLMVHGCCCYNINQGQTSMCMVNLLLCIFVIHFLSWFICDLIYNITLCSEWL